MAQLITLESVLRWGGVVDELEWAAQVHQWTVHGLSDVDDRPGMPLSPLLRQVIVVAGTIRLCQLFGSEMFCNINIILFITVYIHVYCA